MSKISLFWRGIDKTLDLTRRDAPGVILVLVCTIPIMYNITGLLDEVV